MATLNRGWMPGVERVVNKPGTYGRLVPDGSHDAIAVMSHIMQGYQTTMIRWAIGGTVQKSAQFTIGRGGRIVQHVSLYDMSWAAGSPNQPTWSLLPAGWTRSVNRLVINIEHEGFSKPPGYGYDYVYSAKRPWPTAMVLATIMVQRYIFTELGLQPSYDTIIGHRDTDSQTRADDPGSAWPVKRIVESLNAPTVSIPSIWLPDDDVTGSGGNVTITTAPGDPKDYAPAKHDHDPPPQLLTTEEDLAAHLDWHKTA